MNRVVFGVASAAAICALPEGVLLAQVGSAPSRPVILEFLDAPAPGQAIVDVPHLAVGVDGAMRPAVVDTGSTGVVLSAANIPGLVRLPVLGSGTIGKVEQRVAVGSPGGLAVVLAPEPDPKH